MIGNNFVVVMHSDNFCMTSLSCTYGLVWRIWNFTSSIATLHFFDTFKPLQDSFDTPEAPASNYSFA